MEKQHITESMGVHKEWYAQANEQTIETLPSFINHLMNDYSHDYGTICHAITAGGLATMSAMNNSDQGGITGFQAGEIMWKFIRNWNHAENKTGMKLVDYDDLLYPQYEYKFYKTISEDTWRSIQEQAKINLNKGGIVHKSVKNHWQGIISGNIPFGFTVSDEE